MRGNISSNISFIEKKLPLERFIPMVFLVFLLFFLVLTVNLYQNITLYEENVKWVNHTQEVLKKIEKIDNIYLNLSVSFQKYIIKKDSTYFFDVNNSKQLVQNEISGLKPLLSDNEKQKNTIMVLDTLTAEIFELLISPGNNSAGTNKIEHETIIYAYEDRFSDIDDILSELESNENKQLSERNENVVDSTNNIRIFIIIIGLLTFTVIGLALYISNRLINNKNAAEILLNKSHEELEEKVFDRTLELKKANDTLLQEINTRIKAEQSLRESEERFRIMADNAPVMIWMSGLDKKFNFVNKGWLDFTGKTLQQELGTGWSENIHPDDLQQCLDTYILSFDKRKKFEIEYRQKRASGDYIWIYNRGVPRYEGNNFIGYIGCCIDIHQRKINERYLKLQYAVSKTLTRAKTIEEAASKVIEDICSGINREFGILWMLDKSKSVLIPAASWAPNQIKLKEFRRSYSNYKIESGKDLPGIVLETGKSMWSTNIFEDKNFLRKDTAEKLGWNSAFAVPVTNGKEVIAVIECFHNRAIQTNNDLLEVLETTGRQIGNYTERIITETKLKNSYANLEERVKNRTVELANTLNKLLDEISYKEKIQNKLKIYAHAVRGIKECVYITDLNNRTLFINSAYESIFGYYEHELLQKEIPLLYSNGVNNALRDEISAETLRNGWRGELKSKRKNGTEIYIMLSTSVVRNDEGMAEAIVGICQDITELKKSEILILKQNRILKLLNDIIIVTNKSFELMQAIGYAINKVCQYTSWDIGHYFFKNSEGRLESSEIWNYDLKPKYEDFKKITLGLTFEKSEGMPGKSFREGKPYWYILNESDEKIIRAKLANELGLNTLINVPVIKQNEVIGVLEFFKAGEEPMDIELLESITNIGIELGSLAERTDILEQVKLREKQFKAVADTAVDSIITVNFESKIIYINNSTLKIFGYDESELMNLELISLIHESSREVFRSVFKNILGPRGLIQSSIELEAIKKSGIKFPIEFTLAKWSLNNEMFFTAMIKDISLRKQIENELIEKQKLLVETQEIAKLGSWEWDAKTGLVRWSDEMYKIFEIPTGSKITQETYMNLLSSEQPGHRPDEMQNALTNGSAFNYYLSIKTQSGKFKILNSVGEIDKDEDDNVSRMVGTIIDVTEIKQAEERVKQSERLLKEAQLIANLGSWSVNLITGEYDCSDEIFRILDMNSDQTLPDLNGITEFIHYNDAQRVKNIIETLKKEPQPMQLSFRIVTGFGKLKYINAEIEAEIKNSIPVRLFGSIQDITEIKLVEEELRKANEKLIAAQKELIHNEKLAALGRFASGIAHEIRNPLANISALSQLLTKVNLDEKSQKHLKYILINADIANNIIKELLNFASPEELVFKKENLNECLENIIESIAPRCHEKNIKIRRKISALPEVNIDKIKLDNALMNFFSNAIDAMDSGGELTVKAAKNNFAKEINISISDTGSGIPPENIDKILEPFYTTKQNGTGLGLGLAYHTIKAHLGSVKIESEVNKGTTILIKLPLNNLN
jgi:PAS domain S-box-containing protein